MANITTPIFQPTFKSYLLGSSIALFSLPGWLANLLIVIIIVIGRLTEKSPIYYMMASMAVGDFIQLTLLIFYLSPSSALQKWLIPATLLPLPGDIFCICWYHMWYDMIAMGVNRYLIICRPQYNYIFTQRVVKWSVLIGWLFSLIIWSHFLFVPCCRLYMAFPVYSIMLEPHGAKMVNWGDKIVEIPGNTITILVMIFCYSNILLAIKKDHNIVELSVTDEEAKTKMKSEFRVAQQFMAISLCFSLVWIFFRLFPFMAGTKHAEVYILISYMIILNSSLNPWVYFKYNTHIKQALSEWRNKGSTTTINLQTNANTQNHTRRLVPRPAVTNLPMVNSHIVHHPAVPAL